MQFATIQLQSIFAFIHVFFIGETKKVSQRQLVIDLIGYCTLKLFNINRLVRRLLFCTLQYLLITVSFQSEILSPFFLNLVNYIRFQVIFLNQTSTEVEARRKSFLLFANYLAIYFFFSISSARLQQETVLLSPGDLIQDPSSFVNHVPL